MLQLGIMRLHDAFFWCASFFLVGIFVASMGAGVAVSAMFSGIAGAVLAGMAVMREERRTAWLAGCALFIVIGASYYAWDAARFGQVVIPFEKKAELHGIVVRDPRSGKNSQEFVIRLDAPHAGRVLVRTARFPEVRYGDELVVRGTVNRLQEEYARSFEKNRINGIVRFAEVTPTGAVRGSPVLRTIFAFKRHALSVLPGVLPEKQAAFLAGVTVGERAQFSDEFTEAMRVSGTMHVVALSGYNISILAVVIGGIFFSFLARRAAFAATIAVIVGFVIMTGAEASIVRAAIMGVVMMLAEHTRRMYSFRNAVVAAAGMMALVNPKVLTFDLGFQLSFLALLGIIYLKPAIVKITRMSREKGILSWRENLLTTTSAQLAVTPLLLVHFGTLSLVSIPANLLVLEAIPYTMALGFVVMGAGLISPLLALVAAWPARALLVYEVEMIEFFGSLRFAAIDVPQVSMAVLAAYVAALFCVLWYAERRIRA